MEGIEVDQIDNKMPNWYQKYTSILLATWIQNIKTVYIKT